MTLEETIASLPLPVQFSTAATFIRKGMPIWENYATDAQRISYIETVVGTHIRLKRDMLQRALSVAEKALEQSGAPDALEKLDDELYEPIVAIRDMDWEPPAEVEKMIYAVRNYVQAVMGTRKSLFDESMLYVSVNQSIDAIETAKLADFDELNAMLFAIVAATKK